MIIFLPAGAAAGPGIHAGGIIDQLTGFNENSGLGGVVWKVYKLAGLIIFSVKN